MKKTVEKEIYKINRWVKKETSGDVDILDFLFDAEENYEYNDDGEKETCDYITRGLWFEADNFVDVWKENNGGRNE